MTISRNFGLAPAERNIRMMILLFGNRANAINEIKRLFEVRKFERLMQVMLINNFPTREFTRADGQRLAFQWHLHTQMIVI